jgi:hypothetical protein
MDHSENALNLPSHAGLDIILQDHRRVPACNHFRGQNCHCMVPEQGY